MSIRIRGPEPATAPAHPITVHDRQVAVEHDHVVGRVRGGLQRRRAVVDDVGGHPGLTQPLGDPLGQRHMVLDHQHPHPPSMGQAGMTSVQHRM